MGMRLAIIVVAMAMGISGSAFAGQAHKQAAASTAAVAETPADPCTTPEMADHAISEKGTGAANGRMAINTKGTGTAGRMAINTKGTGATANGRMAINTKGTGCNNGKMSPNKHPAGAN